jgi:hypothetical protein
MGAYSANHAGHFLSGQDFIISTHSGQAFCDISFVNSNLISMIGQTLATTWQRWNKIN